MSRSFGVDMARGQCAAAVESRRQGCSWPRPTDNHDRRRFETQRDCVSARPPGLLA